MVIALGETLPQEESAVIKGATTFVCLIPGDTCLSVCATAQAISANNTVIWVQSGLFLYNNIYITTKTRRSPSLYNNLDEICV
jgi:hypothetical protein